MKENTEDTRFWDRLGLCASVLCLIHCLLPPLLLLFLPFHKIAFLEAEIIHDTLALVVITSILIAVYPNCKKHEHLDIVGFAFLGVFFIIGASLLTSFSPVVHSIFTILGSIMLITAHVKNIKVRHGKCIEAKACSH